MAGREAEYCMETGVLLYSIAQLDKILKENTCLLYGAGKTAKTIVKYASKENHMIDGILVSGMQGNPHDIMGISVCVAKDYQKNTNDKVIIVSSMENLHKEITEEIIHFHFKNICYVSNKLLKEIAYRTGDYEIDSLSAIENIERKLAEQERRLLRFVPRPCLEYMVLNILDHCNLRCKGCDHFACIADPYFVPYETIHRDLVRMAEIFQGDYILQIAVMGGEPLLHPDLLRILKDVREQFPYTIIRLTTNGLLLLKQDDKFWSTCRDYDVTIVNTKYPINLDFDKMREKAKNERVRFQFFEGTGEHLVKKSFKKIVNLKGDSNPVESFANCHISNYGNFLMEGKFYGCPFSCQSFRIFNKKFNQKLRITEGDFLDIYKVKDKQEFLSFAARPKFYCRYCEGLSPLFDWERSKKEIYEWIDEEESLS